MDGERPPGISLGEGGGEEEALKADAKMEVAKTDRKVPKSAEATARTKDLPDLRTFSVRWQVGSWKISSAVGRRSGSGLIMPVERTNNNN